MRSLIVKSWNNPTCTPEARAVIASPTGTKWKNSTRSTISATIMAITIPAMAPPPRSLMLIRRPVKFNPFIFPLFSFQNKYLLLYFGFFLNPIYAFFAFFISLRFRFPLFSVLSGFLQAFPLFSYFFPPFLLFLLFHFPL